MAWLTISFSSERNGGLFAGSSVISGPLSIQAPIITHGKTAGKGKVRQ